MIKINKKETQAAIREAIFTLIFVVVVAVVLYALCIIGKDIVNNPDDWSMGGHK